MTTIVLPERVPLAQTWRQVTDSFASPSDPFKSTIQRTSRPGARWGAQLRFDNMRDCDTKRTAIRSALKVFLAELRGMGNEFYMTDRGSVYELVNGSLSVLGAAVPSGNLLSNGYFPHNVSGWSSDANGTITWTRTGARLLRTGAAPAQFWQQVDGLTANADYHVRLYYRRMTTTSLNVRVGSTLHGQELLAQTTMSGSENEPSHLDVKFNTGAGTTAYVEVRCGAAADEFGLLHQVELSRIGLVNGASQTGVVLATDGWPASTDDLLATGTMVEFGGELKRLTSDVHSDSTGAARLYFEPPIRTSPNDDSAVVVYRPRSKFFLPGPEVAWADLIAQRSTFVVDCVEQIE